MAALSSKRFKYWREELPPHAHSWTYEEVVTALNEHYQPKRHEITECFMFFIGCQTEAKPIHTFLVVIRRIADNCNFGNALGRMLKDCSVGRVRSATLLKQLHAKR